MPAKKEPKETAASRRKIATTLPHYSGKGQSFEEDVLEHECYHVAEAVVTQTRIAMDWTEGGDKFHISATSTDRGASYEGHFGEPRADANCRMQIRRFTSTDGTELLIAKWYRDDTGNGGLDIIELSKKMK
jgi:hypothetical protein